MTLRDIAYIRLNNQQIADSKMASIRELVGWMGAIQAQDYPHAKWAVGLRLPGATEQAVQSSIDNAEVIRTHVLRPTWHLVSADDIYWMLNLTAPRIKASLKSRHKELELNDSILKKGVKVITKVLSGNNHLTREQLALQLAKIKIVNDNNRLSHVLLCAELDGIICNGKSLGNKQTYALLEERVNTRANVSREASLEKLANRYLLSHGPATLQDFSWWSGLSVKDARNAFEMVKSDFIAAPVGSQTYWFSESSAENADSHRSSVYLLPAFDEFTISYKDRSAVLAEVHNKKAISDNGIFRPIIVIDGQVVGLWKRSVNKGSLIVETHLFKSSSRKVLKEIEAIAEKFGEFMCKKTQVKHINAS